VIELTRRLESSRNLRLPWSTETIEEKPQIEEESNVPGD